MKLPELVEKLINEHGSAAILRERLAFIRDQAQILEKQNAQLQQENVTLKKRVAELETELRKLIKPDGFIENDGVLWRRKGSGFENSPYCPNCEKHTVLSLMPSYHPMFWLCSVCGFQKDRSVSSPS
jgi:hypothetical protein